MGEEAAIDGVATGEVIRLWCCYFAFLELCQTVEDQVSLSFETI